MADLIEKTTINVDSLTLGGNPYAIPIKFKLEANEVQYKTNTSIRSCEFDVIPDSGTGTATVDLIDTDSMAGDQYYRADFGNGVIYRFQVAVSVAEVDFFDLPNLTRTAYDRDYPFTSDYYTVCSN